MGPAQRTFRVVLFFAVYAVYVAWSGLKLLPIRLLSLVSTPLSREAALRVSVQYHRWLLAWAKIAAAVRLDVEGSVPPGTGYIFCVNHQSIIDGVVLMSTLGPCRPLFVAKEAMRRFVPNVSPAARLMGTAFVSRRSGDRGQIEAVESLARRLEPERKSVVIFLEGTRSRDGALLPFKRGGLAAVLRAAPAARVVPVAIDGTWRAATLAAMRDHFVGMRIRLRIGEPIEVPPEEREDRAAIEAVVERVREFCGRAHGEWRGAPSS